MSMSDKFKDKAEQMKRESAKKMGKDDEKKDRSHQNEEREGMQEKGDMDDRGMDEARKRSDER